MTLRIVSRGGATALGGALLALALSWWMLRPQPILVDVAAVSRVRAAP